jgi:serine/threonine-protein kinase
LQLADSKRQVANLPPRPDLPRFLDIALKVAQALAYAHAKGVIHRDLKPANIMVGAFGEVQVMDWGLAKLLQEGGMADEERAASGGCQLPGVEPTVIRTGRGGTAGSGIDTEAGTLLGTPAYMPPEQANGDVALLDRRADVFGLGAILCEILTGRPPYLGRSQEEVRRKAANGDLADALARLGSCGADAELIVLTKACLSPEAIDRPRDALAVADALTAYVDGVQERLHQAELAEAEAKAKAVEEAKRRRLTLALAGTVLLAVTLGGGGVLWVKSEREAHRAQVAREVNEAINRATVLREQANGATTGGAALLARAREQSQRALALAENGPADRVLKEQARQLQADLDEGEKDRQLLVALDEARLAQAETVASKNDFAKDRAVPLFREALWAYGMPAGQGEPAAVAARIRERPAPVREGLLAALEEWIDLANDPRLALTEPHGDWLRAVMVAAEPQDGWARRVRLASAEKNVAKRREALERLAEEADVRILPVRSLTRLAERLRRVSANASAVRLLRRARQQHAADFWVNHNLGVALKPLTPPERDEAVRFLTTAVALRPESPGAHFNLGNALKDNGQLDEAIACLRKARDLDPRYTAAHLNLGNALREKGMLDEAIASFQKAIQLDPKLSFAHLNLGNALIKKGLLDEAATSFQKAIQLDPKSSPAHANLGYVLANKKLFDAAIACYRKAIEVDPKNVRAHDNLGNALANKGRLDEAIACHRRAIKINPEYAPAHVNLGIALAAKRQIAKALRSFKKAIEIDPKNVAAYQHMGHALSREGRLDEAIDWYRKFIEVSPKHAWGHYNLALALARRGRRDEAIAIYRKTIQLDPHNARAHTNLGASLRQKGELDEAIACFRKGIELDPTLMPAYYNLGLALLARERLDEAIACFRKVCALDPKLPTGHANLGRALHEKGQLDEAGRSFREALRLAPNDPLAQSRLARTKRLAAARDNFAVFRDGRYRPGTNEERLGLAEWCRFKKLHRTAAGLYAEVFAADARLADDLNDGSRSLAASAAALAAAGRGEDASGLDDTERARLRKQALDWLRADLALRTRQLPGADPTGRATVQWAMRQWLDDRSLAGIRDAAALAKLPADERAEWERIWADVAALLKKAEGGLGLVLESLELPGVQRRGEGHHLERHPAVERPLDRLVDDAHAAAAHLAQEQKVTQRLGAAQLVRRVVLLRQRPGRGAGAVDQLQAIEVFPQPCGDGSMAGEEPVPGGCLTGLQGGKVLLDRTEHARILGGGAVVVGSHVRCAMGWGRAHACSSSVRRSRARPRSQTFLTLSRVLSSRKAIAPRVEERTEPSWILVVVIFTTPAGRAGRGRRKTSSVGR